jgi:DNA (cytosine-5)-methyltransferase 3A
MKLLIGGSPCTHWSIAQMKNRETEASGIGWELFLNYRIARDKYKPDFFLYENNKSMSPAIRAQITAELGVEPVLINSALVSAQNRQRLYWAGKRNPDGTYSQVAVEQPEDRGILLRDILETGVAWSEKSYCITATEAKGSNPQQTLTKHRRTMVAEPIVVNGMKNGKARTVDAHMGNLENNLVPRINNPNQAKQQYDCIAEPVRIGTIESKAKNTDFDSQQYRVYSPDGKSVTLCGQGGGVGAKTGLYAVPVIPDGKGQFVIKAAGGKEIPVYEVRDGKICVMVNQKGETERVENWFPIKLADGFYIIRKLTVTECKRLQTVPEEYGFPVSATQAYKMLGNGWTVDVIAHIMSHFTGLTADPVEVLSMYDGMSCGHIALDKLGVQPWLLRYYATEIDKYAIQTTQHNYPDTVQLGDAFQVRNDDWRLEG